VQTHFQWWNLTGCPNKQFNETQGSWLQMTCSLLVFLILGPPAFLLTLAFFLACPCICIPASLGDPAGPRSFFATVTTMMVFILGVSIAALVGTPIVVAVFLTIVPLSCLLGLLRVCLCGRPQSRRRVPGNPALPVRTDTGTEDDAAAREDAEQGRPAAEVEAQAPAL
jgi:hypothetical protein